MDKTLAEKIVKILDEKKATDIVALEISSLTVVADYFVIASATSNTHLKALADEVEYRLGLEGIEPNHIEGKATGWILLDYGMTVVHLFQTEAREYYNLERLWDDGARLDISHLITEN